MADPIIPPDDAPRPPHSRTLTPPAPPPQSPNLIPKLTPRFLQSENVSGARSYAYGGQPINPQLGAFYQSLPPWIDDNQRAFGMDIYDQMARDPGVYTPLRTVVAQVLADGIELRPRIDDKDDPNYVASKKQLDFATAYLDDLPRSLEDLSYEMLAGAMCHGSRVAEQVMGVDDETGKWVIDRIKPKPRRNVGFVVDAYMELTGFLPMTPGQFSTLAVYGASLADLKNQNVLPKEKFCWLTWAPEDGDPRGSSLLRPLFSSWWQKQQLIREYIKGLSQFGTPTLVGELGEDPFPAPGFDANANAASGTELSVADAMRNGLIQIRNGAVFVHSNGGKVYTLDVPAVGEQLLAALDRIDKQMEKAITLQTLATGEAKFGTKSLGDVHQDTAGTGLRYPRMIMANMWNRLLRLVVKLNDGDKAARTVAPYVSMTATEQQDWATELGAVATAYTSGFLVDQQRPALYERLGLPDVDPAVLEQQTAQKDAAMQAQIEATKAKAAPPAAAAETKGKPAEFADDADETGGRWVTMDGQHVYINKAGMIEKGPAHLVGRNMNDTPPRSDGKHNSPTAEMLPDGLQSYPFVKIASDDPLRSELEKLGGLWDGKAGGVSFRYCNFSLKGSQEERLNEANRRIVAAKENVAKEANRKAEAVKGAKPRTGKEELPKGQDVYYRVQWSGDSLSRNFKSKNFQNDKEEAGTSATRSFKDLMTWIATVGGAPTGDVEIVAFRGDHVGVGDDNEPLVRPTEELARYRNPEWKWTGRAAALADKAGENEDEALRELLDKGWREVSTKKVAGRKRR
jgi:hypothetical protein